MAGLGKKTFSDGEVLSAADVNGYLMDQSVMRFADDSARTAAIGTPTEGMVTYLDDVNQIEVYDGTAWVDQQAPILSEGTAGQYLQSNGTAGSQWVTLEIADNIITTEGDLIVGGSDNTPERLPIGAEDTVLTSDGTAVTWAAAGGGGGFNTITEVTASDSSYDVSGITGFARITLAGGGGGGSRSLSAFGEDGGATSVVSGTTYTASGGLKGTNGFFDAGDGILRVANYGSGNYNTNLAETASGQGGELKTIYLDLTSISSIDITIGAGGDGGSAAGAGGNGLVTLEYSS